MPIHYLTSSTNHAGEDFFIEDKETITNLWTMEERHFWYACRNRWIASAFLELAITPPARILEVGCGSGAVANYLTLKGYKVAGIDTAEILVRKAAERNPETDFFCGKIEDLGEDRAESFDALGFFDVIEHLNDPEQLISASLRFLRPNGVVLISVPARQSAFSAIDRLSGHKKRYEMGEVSKIFDALSMEPLFERSIFRFTAPLQRFGLRRSGGIENCPTPGSPEARNLILQYSKVPSIPVNTALRMVCTIESWLSPAGSGSKNGMSLIAAGRKR